MTKIINKFLAAHCISPNTLQSNRFELKGVRLGEYNLLTSPDCGEGVRDEYLCAPEAIDFSIEQQIIHENFNENHHNDIALLKLHKDVKYNRFVRPICLPYMFTVDTDKINFIVTGFGQTESGESSNIKLKTNLGNVKNDECEKLMMAQSGRPIVQSQICAIGVDSKDSCQGIYLEC